MACSVTSLHWYGCLSNNFSANLQSLDNHESAVPYISLPETPGRKNGVIASCKTVTATRQVPDLACVHQECDGFCPSGEQLLIVVAQQLLAYFWHPAQAEHYLCCCISIYHEHIACRGSYNNPSNWYRGTSEEAEAGEGQKAGPGQRAASVVGPGPRAQSVTGTGQRAGQDWPRGQRAKAMQDSPREERVGQTPRVEARQEARMGSAQDRRAAQGSTAW